MRLVDIIPIIDFAFWQKLYYLKLDELKLSEDPIEVVGRAKCTKFENEHVRLHLDSYSFDVNSPYKVKYDTFHTVQLKGYVKVINKKTDMPSILEKTEILTEELKSKDLDTNFDFYIVLYIDHKKFDFSYHFFQTKRVNNFTAIVAKTTIVDKHEFIANSADIESSNGVLIDGENNVVCDTLVNTNIGKIVLNYTILSRIYESGPVYIVKEPLIISEESVGNTMVAKAIKVEFRDSFEASPSLLLVPVQKDKSINLKSFLSKEQMIEDQSSLNLKLMKWRLEPRLDLQKLSETKILILGTGTLGCNLARLLVAYGIKNFTFLDNSYVSYSNLARQSLFNIESFDEQDKGLPKVEAAKINLLKIAPDAKVETVHLNVPMPGHYAKSDQIDAVLADLDKLEELVRTHDVIFNVFDSREARYFPTILSALHGKLCMSIGVGYESFVIVKHGNYGTSFYTEVLDQIANDPVDQILEDKADLEEPKIAKTEDIEWQPKLLNDNGCFFCSDYLPPTDSMTNRALDQQCTVSRPGISMISCGVAAELLVNTLHNGVIGKTPHFIRGLIGGGFELADYENSKYDNCVACSLYVIIEYVKNRKEFLYNVLNNPDVLNTYTKFNENVDLDGDAEFEEIIEFDSSWRLTEKDEE